jgi:hypothetical protein
MTPSIPIFPNEINTLEDFRGRVKVARDFAIWRPGSAKMRPATDNVDKLSKLGIQFVKIVYSIGG